MKTIQKPWGKEEWIVLTDKYCLKKIYVNKGHRLSLQYHEKKEETMILEEGDCDLILSTRDPRPRRCIPMVKGEIYTIKPPTVHRLEAKEDSVILEVSTPEVDDVVRLEDDYERNNEKEVK